MIKNYLNQIIQGDCLEVMKNIPDRSIDMILCDLPYGITACRWDISIPFALLWKQYKRIVKDNGVIILTASQPFASKLIISNIEWFRYEWIWDKVSGSNFLNIKNRSLKTQEQILVFSKSSHFIFNPIRVPRTEKSLKRDPVGEVPIRRTRSIRNLEHYALKTTTVRILAADGRKHPVDIIKFSRQGKGVYKIKHPTKKPIALFEYLIKTYTNEGSLVLDNCAGSGTTGVACKNLNRNFILIEKDEKYCEIARKRLESMKSVVSVEAPTCRGSGVG